MGEAEHPSNGVRRFATTGELNARIAELPEGCMDCACCAAWATSLELLRGHLRVHEARQTAIAKCPEGCLICDTSWQGQ